MQDEHTVTYFFSLLSTQDLKQMEPLLYSDARLYFPKTQPLVGRDRILRFFKILFRQYPTLSFNIQRIIRQKHFAAVHWTNQGISRRGEPYQNEGMTLMEITRGKISFISDFFKDTEKF